MKLTKLIIGLGNPGRQYNGTRHNIGFAVVDRLAESFNISFHNFSHVAELSDRANMPDTSVMLAKPITYMNESGIAVRKLVEYYKVSLENVLVVVDDFSIDFGSLRFRIKGSAGGHNGLKSIYACGYGYTDRGGEGTCVCCLQDG